MIDNCTENNIQACSVNFRLGKLFKLKAHGVVDPPKNMPEPQEIELPYVLEPGEYVLASTIEKMNQTKTEYSALVTTVSKMFRIGLSVQSGLIHPSYKGEVIVGLKNISENRIKLRRGMRMLHLCFFDIKSDIMPIHHGYQYGKVI